MRATFAATAARHGNLPATEGWKRTALLSCAALLLFVAGAVSHALAPRSLAAGHLSGAIVDGFLPSDHGIRPGQAAPRITADRRQLEPGFDRAPPPEILTPVVPVITPTPDSACGDWTDRPCLPRHSRRLAHRPRGPPTMDRLPTHHRGTTLIVRAEVHH
ncbi:MAG: hypothetical protein KF889_25050 [Alphaproteobacteria bacterium]|nr:hypothetical protein [Alphaproteobacteria bacterium]MCW5742728.1 hypothetical protein [Alphaproteobacteria bacterium]